MCDNRCNNLRIAGKLEVTGDFPDPPGPRSLSNRFVVHPAFPLARSRAVFAGVHLCLRARSVAEIDAFYAAALEAGAVPESPPSLRPHDRVRYYAAFIVDHDGNRVEAVTFLKDEARAS